MKKANVEGGKLTDEENEGIVLKVVLHLGARSRPLVVDESLGRRNDGEASLREIASKVGRRSVVAVHVRVLVAGDPDRVAKVARRARLEHVVADRASVRARGRAVVGTPDHATDRDADLHHVRVGDQRVALDDGAVERSRPRVPVDHVDAAERATVPRDDRVARDGRTERTKDDDTSVGAVGDRVASHG